MSEVEQIFLELREKDSILKNANGDFTITLKKPLHIESGDSIILNSAFIDTVATTSDNISLDTNIQIEYTFGYYMVCQNSSITRYIADLRDSTKNQINANNVLDGKKYVLMKRSRTNTPVPGYHLLEKQKFIYQGKSDDNPYIKLQFEYLDLDDKLTKGTSWFGSPRNKDNIYYADLNIVAKDGSYKILNEQYIFNNNYIYSDNIPQKEIYNYHFSPVLNSYTLTIPAGVYTRTQIAKYMNDQMDINNVDNTYLTDIPVDNPFLKSTTDINTGSQATQLYYFVNLESDTGFAQKQGNAFYCDDNIYYGTNQLDIEYDQVQQKFYYNYLHFPVYDNNGNIITLFQSNNIRNGHTRYMAIGSYSGIFFSSIHTTDENGNHIDFYENELGFKLIDELIVNIHKPKLNKIIGDSGKGGYDLIGEFPDIKLEDSKNTTNAYLGIDIGVQKTNQYYTVPGFNLTSTISSTQQIYAENSISLKGDSSAYFLIDLNIPFNNTIINNTDIRKNIYAIVSKYYSLDSYTSKEGSSILYTHKGATQILSNIRVRILKPDYTIASDIGDDNTIFIQINKVNKTNMLEHNTKK